MAMKQHFQHLHTRHSDYIPLICFQNKQRIFLIHHQQFGFYNRGGEYFSARYGLSPYITEIHFVYKGLNDHKLFFIVVNSLIYQQNTYIQQNTCIIINTMLHVSMLIAPFQETIYLILYCYTDGLQIVNYIIHGLTNLFTIILKTIFG
jgi:hypothetical protein